MKSQQRMTALQLLAARSQRRQACSRSLRKLIEIILMIYVNTACQYRCESLPATHRTCLYINRHDGIQFYPL